MTITADNAPRMDLKSLAPRVYRAMLALDAAAGEGLEPPLKELVRIRASQLNGCVYCIDMHSTDARKGGESEQRLYGVAAWRETPYFTDRERAALAFTESVTLVADTHVPAEDYAAVAEHFSPDEIGALVSLIVAINAWNAISVATRAWQPGSYVTA